MHWIDFSSNRFERIQTHLRRIHVGYYGFTLFSGKKFFKPTEMTDYIVYIPLG